MTAQQSPAFSAAPSSLARIDIKIVASVEMAANAMRSFFATLSWPKRPGCKTVFDQRAFTQMSRIDAGSIPAEMVNDQAVADWPIEDFIAESVGKNHRLGGGMEASIACRLPSNPYPTPAAFAFIDMTPETILNWHWWSAAGARLRAILRAIKVMGGRKKLAAAQASLRLHAVNCITTFTLRCPPSNLAPGQAVTVTRP